MSKDLLDAAIRSKLKEIENQESYMAKFAKRWIFKDVCIYFLSL